MLWMEMSPVRTSWRAGLFFCVSGDASGSFVAAAVNKRGSPALDERVTLKERWMTSKIVSMIAVAVIYATASAAGEQTWTGRISDSLCGASHDTMASAASLSNRDCTLECIKAGGKYVLVDSKNRVIAIANQDFAGLPEYADQGVKVTGEMKGDAIFVTKLEMLGHAE